MEHLEVNIDAEGAWTDLQDGDYEEASGIRVGGLRQATLQGNPVVAIRLDVPDGPPVLGITTLKLFLTAADTLKAGLGDPREEGT